MPRLLITAGPTQEPIDAVRFIGNRSSGRLGIDLARAALARGWQTTLLLGIGASLSPHALESEAARLPGDLVLERFRSTADLAASLDEHFPGCDTLVMAAAVADYRPILTESALASKTRRKTERLVIECEPTPDLLASVAARKKSAQLVVGFALEPESELEASAIAKLQRKNADLIVANPLETMDSETIRATIVARNGIRVPEIQRLDRVRKSEFGSMLLDAIAAARRGLGVSA